jgi:type I restriction enzyme, S subunit
MNWDESKLGDVAKVISGFAFKSKDFSKNKGVPVIKIKNIQKEKVEVSDEYFLDESFLSINSKFHCKKDDILISLTGSHITLPNSVVGRVAKYHYNFTSLLNQRGGKIVVTDENKLVNNYLYYYLCQPEVRTILALFGRGGANQVNISPSNVESIKIDLPPIQTQERIADILSDYDDLIENNLKRIKLLEQAAQNIYKEWFVNLRFPGHENTPINEETGLPEGWEEKPLGDIISKLESGSRPKGGIDKSLKKGVPSIGAESVRGLGYFDFSKTKYIKEVFFGKMRKGVLEDRDILIYKDGAYIGRSTLFQDNFPFEKCSINEHIFLIHAKNELLQYYLYFTLHSSLYFEKMQSLNSNAAQPGINQKKIKTLPIICPSSNLLIKFDSMVIPMISEIYKLAKMNLKLKTGRDILLPRLMNRTIEI